MVKECKLAGMNVKHPVLVLFVVIFLLFNCVFAFGKTTNSLWNKELNESKTIQGFDVDDLEYSFKNWHELNFEDRGKALFTYNYHMTGFNNNIKTGLHRICNFDFGVDFLKLKEEYWKRGEYFNCFLCDTNCLMEAGMDYLCIYFGAEAAGFLIYEAPEYIRNYFYGNDEGAGAGTKIHGNSLQLTKTNYGYALRDKTTDAVLKYGETISPKTRYSQTFLEKINAYFDKIIEGSKIDIHNWQHQQILDYIDEFGVRPPLNKSNW